MMRPYVQAKSLNGAYIELTKIFQWNREGMVFEMNGRQQGTIHEIRDIVVEIENPRCSLLSVPYRNMSKKYAAAEFALYMSQSNRVEDFGHYASTWKKLASEHGFISSAYGYRIFCERDVGDANASRFDYALSQLIQNEETKNAVIMMRDDSDMASGLKDRCCTLYVQFFIRNGKLDCKVAMRSSDFWFGFPYDVFWYTTLQQIMLFRYNEAQKTHVGLGSFTMECNSLHVYEAQWDKIKTAELPAYYNADKEYEFPVFDKASNEQLRQWLFWEKYVYRPACLEEDVVASALQLRHSKFSPFLETMGSLLLNKIKTRYATKQEVEFFQKAKATAQNSTCIDRKVGCVLTDSSQGTSVVAYNKVLECDQNCDDKVNRLCVTRHAEICALDAANEAGMLPDKAYVTLYPCLPCMQALKKAGIQEVVVVGFSHKGAVGEVTLIDPAFTEGV